MRATARSITIATALAAGTLPVTTALSGCGDDPAPQVDAGPALPPLSPELPPAHEAMGVRRGLSPARGIIHLHSPYSHDACDGEPRDEDTGAIDEDCLADLRAALCATREDFAALTDHDDSMADEDFETLFVTRGDDELVRDQDDNPIAARLRCTGGEHEVLVFVGGENALMPIMLDRHPDGTVEERHDIYNADTPEAVDLFRQLDGLSFIAHAENRTIEELRLLRPDGFEIYNLHANIDPDIREEYLGLPAAGAIQAVAEFADTNPTAPEPDLALMSFVEPNQVALGHWDTLLGEGWRVSGSAGTDAHQNSLPLVLRDGERGDSYRRMIRWFANVALVTDRGDPAAIEAAIAQGRFFVAFEIFGTPAGFDVLATTGTGAGVELGGEVDVSGGDSAELAVTLPTVYQLDPSLPEPDIRGRILRLDGDGQTVLADGSGPLAATIDRVGAYRVEVMITPRHLGPYLGHLGPGHAEREHVWIYANPIYAR